jgi:AAHS family 4-hydroxybenzoate transporter-like MFS transporter
MATPAKVNIATIIDDSKIGAFQIGLFILCAMCLIMDGFDVQALGFVNPRLIAEWGATPPQLGNVAAATNFGVLLGALVLSVVADKLGRRPVLVWGTLFFALMTLLTAAANSINTLLLLRFIGGIGLGCIMPNATALIGEYSPKRSRVMLMMGVTVGFTAGAALAGIISYFMIPAYGWRAVFIVGGILPLLIGILMFFKLPESLQFMAVQGTSRGKIAAALNRIDPKLKADSNTQYVLPEEKKGGVPLLHVFGEGRAVATILFWIVNFMNLLNLYAVAVWGPTVLINAGHSGPTALLAGTAFQVGGTVGAFGLAWLIGRYGFVPMLTANFAIACASIFLIGQPGLSVALLFVIIFVAGWCVVGGQPGLNALEAVYYPTYVRSTGVGWCLGVGRIGAIVGPMVGGVLIANKWSNQELFMAAAIPALVSCLVMFSLRWLIKPQSAANIKSSAVVVH